jgi:fructokinase
MKKIICSGELLIDFIPKEKGRKIKDIENFIKKPGGAPANVCVQAAKLGTPAKFIGQVGKDGFGDFLKRELEHNHVDVSHLYQTDAANTALAFVTLTHEGERDFVFYRSGSADQILNQSQISHIDVTDSIFHFGSLSLDDYPLKDAIRALLVQSKVNNCLVSFDPNLRFSLFKDLRQYQKVIIDFMSYTDILKVSDDELTFITKKDNEYDAINYLFNLGIKYLIITRGKDGVTFIDKNRTLHQDGFKVKVKDTTGAGDSWIGAFLAQIADVDNLDDYSDDQILEILNYANAAAAITTTNIGAISALPSASEVDSFIKKHNSKKHRN